MNHSVSASDSTLFPQRVGRMSFLARNLVCVVVMTIGAALLALGVAKIHRRQAEPSVLDVVVGRVGTVEGADGKLHAIVKEPPTGVKAMLAVLGVAILLLGLYYFIRHVVAARVRDIGLHTAYAFLALVPLVGSLFVVALLFIPRDKFKRAS